MNLREKFIWNVLVGFASISIIWFVWNLYNLNSDTNKLLSNYKNEQVGTDEKLQNKVNELQNIYSFREAVKFKVSENPFDLSRVISGGGKSKLWVSGIINRPDGSNMAIINYKNDSFNVLVGQSVAGGTIEEITPTQVTFKKDDRLFYFNLGVDSNIE
mgnify:CR=1 FL=1